MADKMEGTLADGLVAGSAINSDAYQKQVERKHLFTTFGGEQIYRQDNSIVVKLPPGRSAVTTSWLNGGQRDDLECIFNHTIPYYVDNEKDLEGGNLFSYLAITAERLGFDSSRCAGLLTAASMENVSIISKSFRGVQVTAVVTGGIDVNGGRAGDPASYYQEHGEVKMINGTINTILLINASLPPYTLTRALMTATEAKTVALQELMASSCYSCGLATGSGTDMIAVVSNNSSEYELTDSGKHSKLGELIGTCVIEATKEALAKQSRLAPIYQQDILVRLERFGIKEEKIWEMACELAGENCEDDFRKELRRVTRIPAMVGITSSILHIVDEISWGLLPEQDGKRAAFSSMRGLPSLLGPDESFPLDELLDENEGIIDNWMRITAWIVKNNIFSKTGQIVDMKNH